MWGAEFCFGREICPHVIFLAALLKTLSRKKFFCSTIIQNQMGHLKMHTPTFSLQPGILSPYYVESAAVGCFDNFLLEEPYLKEKIPALSQIPSHVDYQQFHVSPPQVALTSFGKPDY